MQMHMSSPLLSRLHTWIVESMANMFACAGDPGHVDGPLTCHDAGPRGRGLAVAPVQWPGEGPPGISLFCPTL